MIFAQDADHLLRLRGLGELGEAPQIAEHHGDLAAMAFQNLLFARETMSSAICGERNLLRRLMRSISPSCSATRCSSVRFIARVLLLEWRDALPAR